MFGGNLVDGPGECARTAPSLSIGVNRIVRDAGRKTDAFDYVMRCSRARALARATAQSNHERVVNEPRATLSTSFCAFGVVPQYGAR